jgi:hypothetical protein
MAALHYLGRVAQIVRIPSMPYRAVVVGGDTDRQQSTAVKSRPHSSEYGFIENVWGLYSGHR